MRLTGRLRIPNRGGWLAQGGRFPAHAARLEGRGDKQPQVLLPGAGPLGSTPLGGQGRPSFQTEIPGQGTHFSLEGAYRLRLAVCEGLEDPVPKLLLERVAIPWFQRACRRFQHRFQGRSGRGLEPLSK